MTFVLSDPDHSSGPEKDKRRFGSGLERYERRSPKPRLFGQVRCCAPSSQLSYTIAQGADPHCVNPIKPRAACYSKCLPNRGSAYGFTAAVQLMSHSCQERKADGLRLDVGFAPMSVVRGP